MNGLGPLAQGVVILIAVAPLLMFWAWMLNDMLQNRQLTATARTTWLIVFVVFNVFGAGIYYMTIHRGGRP